MALKDASLKEQTQNFTLNGLFILLFSLWHKKDSRVPLNNEDINILTNIAQKISILTNDLLFTFFNLSRWET